MITYQEVEQAEERYLAASAACDLDQTEENELALDAAWEDFVLLQGRFRIAQFRSNSPASTLTPEKIKSILLTQK